MAGQKPFCGGGGLVLGAANASEADVVDDEDGDTGVATQALVVGIVSQARVEIVHQPMEAAIKDLDAGAASAHGDRFDDVTFTSATGPSEDDVLVSADEIELGELEDEGLVDGGLEIEIERFERGPLGQARIGEAAVDGPCEAVLDVASERSLDESEGGGPLFARPGEDLVERLAEAGKREDLDILSHAGLDEGGMGVGRLAHSGLVGSWLGGVSVGHGGGSSVAWVSLVLSHLAGADFVSAGGGSGGGGGGTS